MEATRAAARELVADGVIEITQKGKVGQPPPPPDRLDRLHTHQATNQPTNQTNTRVRTTTRRAWTKRALRKTTDGFRGEAAGHADAAHVRARAVHARCGAGSPQ